MEHDEQGQTELINSAKKILMEALKSEDTFTNGGVLTAHLGGRFKRLHPEGKSFKEIFPQTSITQFIRDNLKDCVTLRTDPSNPIRIYAVDGSVSEQEGTDSLSSSRVKPIPKGVMPRKLFKLRSFLSSLSPEERQKFSIDGELLWSILQD
ncbi:hypothetical protein L3V16_08495 [Brucella ciceri]|uniref:hypothetical protein n=1 Tax=Brucella ciceri TaxID=391287 RepID=UPI001F1460F9|nr:hypothetical protein [Brucella ciceri]MCH6203881.1 hypothetical protein [Brucella ciceri]